ncbi:MAG: 2-amino-4-hydroxy-6-hydroxymethyldihydropteridine diphosphokinase [Gammaproteobacteria bacterium]|nr:2-amino-4-hydroxy-6-hydroxymethyldihydropteridine diphosphokinase [Gammaproteobacteria bacterium]MCW8911109.1 2-amino-4-hydroxy-6-hydroxymethyldihydropteridine diphosphokinase [Gammaproteobacteria bacterium]MCW9005669.1 2-amino-4-hydroxy-6-hydroxymethyldihydropteridine diphosphokinase [Gammaproteobacteria bacterium]MCW9055468.1 2-amino-4-hydroxy-6-hydroxymethyldihydropteridine diphosphokinase [Gammaproteobacteria bacterium]
MARVFISLGSNIDRRVNTRAGIQALRAKYDDLRLSSVYESEAVGFEGDSFYNMVIALNTDDDVHQVAATLRQIEDDYGRDRSGPKFSSRTLDLDLLLYDDLIVDEQGLQIPRDEILKRAFVLWPLAEVAPDLKHPVEQKSYATLWMEFDKSKEQLHPIVFDF